MRPFNCASSRISLSASAWALPSKLHCTHRSCCFRSEKLLIADVLASNFAKNKHKVIDDLAANRNDKSIAGGVDEGILPLVQMINSFEEYYTTSSCSGRVSVFHRVSPSSPTPTRVAAAGSGDGHDNATSGAVVVKKRTPRKKRGEGLGFIWSTHDPDYLLSSSSSSQSSDATTAGKLSREIWEKLEIVRKDDDGGGGGGGNDVEEGSHHHCCSRLCPRGTVEIKFEPVILHIRCRDVDAAQKLLDAAAASGLRKCGMTAPPLRVPLLGEERREIAKAKIIAKQNAAAAAAAAAAGDFDHNNNYNVSNDIIDSGDTRRTSSSFSVVPDPIFIDSATLKTVPSSMPTRNFHVAIGSTAGLNNLFVLEGRVLLEGVGALEDLLKHTSSLFEENERRKARLLKSISGLKHSSF